MFHMLRILVLIWITIIISSNTVTIANELTERRASHFIKPEEVTVEKSLDKAADRARHVLYIIDDLYKLYITLTAEKYARDTETFSSVAITQKVFKFMEKKGWHQARFLSVSRFPLNPEHSPKDNFDRNAIKAIVSGENTYERFFFDVKGKNYLRAATGVPMTSKKCSVCHSNKKVGDLIGIISYTFSLEKYLQ